MFEPLHGHHSIRSVVIRATGSGSMMETDRPNLQREYANRWKSVLPAEQVSQQIQIAVGVVAKVPGSDEPEPLAPTQYADYTPSGEAAWWMELGHNVVTIGTSQYTNWSSIWGKTTGLLTHVGKTLGSGHPMGQIHTLELTYDDMFVWNRNDASDICAPEQAIDGNWMPKRAKSAKEWHSGQGWIDDPSGKRILERFQISGVIAQAVNGDSRPAITIQTTAIQGFGGRKPIFELAKCSSTLHEINSDRSVGAHRIGNDLHDRTKRLLHELLVPTMSNRIGLEVK